MDKEKKFPFENEEGAPQEQPKEAVAPRARNRTVMLTPEITGQVRARLAQDMGQGGAAKSAESAPPPELSGTQNYYVPPARNRAPTADPTPAPRSVYSAPPPAVGESREGVIWQKKSPVIGFLVSFDVNPNGDVYDLRSGRLMITSEPGGSNQNYLLVKDDTVSMNHAILRISANGDIQVLDQLSEFGTRIKRFGTDEEIELSGDKGSLEHGDVISFGNRRFHVCLIAIPPMAEGL